MRCGEEVTARTGVVLKFLLTLILSFLQRSCRAKGDNRKLLQEDTKGARGH